MYTQAHLHAGLVLQGVCRLLAWQQERTQQDKYLSASNSSSSIANVVKRWQLYNANNIHHSAAHALWPDTQRHSLAWLISANTMFEQPSLLQDSKRKRKHQRT